ncbi:MAG: aldose epimerase family protein [Roseibium sp.]
MTLNDPRAIEISNDQLSAKIIPFGASLTDLRLEPSKPPLVLGYEDTAVYLTDGQYMGAVVGRYANRIANGTAAILDQSVQLERNELGKNHLHGGANGFAVKHWNLENCSNDSVTFSLESLDGDAGFPGHLKLRAIYEILKHGTLRLTISATSTKDTLINICHHPYFDFSGTGQIDDHRLQIASQLYLPSGDDLIPLGHVEDATGGPFDFSNARPLSQHDYNNTYCLHEAQSGKLTHAATLSGHGVNMELWTTQPGLHLYNGYKLFRETHGHTGKPYRPYSGICLEAQAWPNGPNQQSFPPTILAAGSVYEQITEYRFTAVLSSASSSAN